MNINEQRIQELYNVYLPGEELDGGIFVQSTPIYKELVNLLSSIRPSERFPSEYTAFELAIKILALEFCKGDNYGAFSANSYSHFIENKMDHVNMEDLVGLLKYLLGLEDFKESDLDCDYDNGTVTDRKSGQKLSSGSLCNMVKSFLELKLQTQMERITFLLCEKQNRSIVIKLLAGSDKEEHIESAEYRFNRILGL